MSLTDKISKFNQSEAAHMNNNIKEQNEKHLQINVSTNNFKTLAYELPLFERKEIHFLPQDVYLTKSLKFSTFVIEDLILLHLNQTFMLFTKQGRITSLSIDPKVHKLMLSKQDLKLVQVKNINKDSGTIFLMEDSSRYYVLLLENKNFKMQLSLDEAKSLDKLTDKNSLVLYQDSRIDIFGNLY
jgi:hypothetical protein